MQNLDTLKNKLAEIYGTKLLSLYLYNDSPIEVTHHAASKLNLLIILSQADYADLDQHQKAQKELENLFKNQQISYKIFTKEELTNSLDVFPIEFLSIKEHRTLLTGEDILAKMDVSKANLRMECEFYLRSFVLKLRSGLLQPKRNLTALITDSFPQLLTLFRFLLEINNQCLPQNNAELITAAGKQLGFNTEILKTILANHKAQNLEQYFPDYLNELVKITTQVDKMNAK
jgi:hypothetical protein